MTEQAKAQSHSLLVAIGGKERVIVRQMKSIAELIKDHIRANWQEWEVIPTTAKRAMEAGVPEKTVAVITDATWSNFRYANAIASALAEGRISLDSLEESSLQALGKSLARKQENPASANNDEGEGEGKDEGDEEAEEILQSAELDAQQQAFEQAEHAKAVLAALASGSLPGFAGKPNKRQAAQLRASIKTIEDLIQAC